MLGNYALSLYRTLTRHRLYALLNTFGLSLGLAVCTILFLVVRFETGFDHWAPHRDAIFRINRISTFPGSPKKVSPYSEYVAQPRLLADFPQILAAARIADNNLVVRNGAAQAFERVMFADPSVWDIFPLPFVEGDRATSLSDPSSAVITQAIARKYFGTDRVVGRQLTIVVNGEARPYRVSGVLRNLPPDTNLVMDVVIRLGPESLGPTLFEMLKTWGSSVSETFVRLRSPDDADVINKAFPAFFDREAVDIPKPASRYETYELVPLAKLHLQDAGSQDTFRPGVDGLFVAALGVMGAVTLVIAVVNYVSLATARAGMRAREVAIRKVMGATRRMLIWQFVGEAVVIAMVAGLIGAALMELALPAVSAVLGEPIRARYFGPEGILAPLMGLCVVVGLAAGVYPAWALSQFRPASVLASARAPGGGRAGARLREALAVGQFAIAICLMVCTAVIFGQMQHLRSADVGFKRDGLLIVRGMGDPQVSPQAHTLLEAFRHTRGVISATVSDRRPAPDTNSAGNVTRLSNPAFDPNVLRERIGSDYAKTYGLKLIAGRLLDTEHSLDDMMGIGGDAANARGLNIMINASAARALGYSDPKQAIGEIVRIGHTDHGAFNTPIVGVVADTRFENPREQLRPQLYMMDSQLRSVAGQMSWAGAVRVREGDQEAVRQRLEQVWKSLAPGAPFQGETVQVTMKPFYDSDARRGQLFAAGAVLSAAIACLGLYGLAAFNTSRRVKEIGIRKTLGASTADVLRLLVGEFLRPVLWANLVAWPVAYLAMRWWLAGFDQRISLNPIYFLAPSLAAIAVAVLTVAEQAIRVSRAEPSRALRYE
ncbi:MAG: ABC transporter permease [Phenylobacterium sp.]